MGSLPAMTLRLDSAGTLASARGIAIAREGKSPLVARATLRIAQSPSLRAEAFFSPEISRLRINPVHARGLPQLRSILPMRTQRRHNLVVRGLFGLGVPELAVIAGVAVILFGPKKLPEFGKSLGKTVKSFQQAAKEFESEIKSSKAGGEEEPTQTDSENTESPVNTVPPSTTTSSSKDSA